MRNAVQCESGPRINSVRRCQTNTGQYESRPLEPGAWQGMLRKQNTAEFRPEMTPLASVTAWQAAP